jgi:acyl transferase domain-containing protein
MPFNPTQFHNENETMKAPFNPLSPSFEFLRDLSATTLAGSEEVIAWQIDHAQAFIGRSTKHLQAGLSQVHTLEHPENWSEAMESGLHRAIETSRLLAVSSADFNLETYNFMQKKAIDTQKALVETWSEKCATLQSKIPHLKPQKHAAA